MEQLVNNILILEKGQVVDFGDKDELFRKYCGKTVITVDNTPENEEITKNFLKLEAPGHLIALSCQNDQTEKDIAELLIRKDINFRRSNNNIEIMSINAKNKFNGGGKRD